MDALEMSLLYDYYGGLLTDKQSQCFDLRYNQDLSLGEIAQVLGVSRQAVCDNLTRTEALLRRMEENIGCVSRDLKNRKTLKTILDAAENLKDHPDNTVSDLARQIIAAAQGLEE
ncbi:MAG: YlxM family DNA-binding protein [Faecousia sp.]